MKEFFNITELSEFLSIPKATLYGMTARGDIPAFKVGRLVRYRISEIEHWITNKKIITGSEEKKAKNIVKSLKKASDTDLDKFIAKVKKEIL